MLLRSGIGPVDHLRELGIPVIADLPGVGENLLDHPLASPDRPRPRLVRPEHAPSQRSFIPVIAKARSRHAGDDIDLHVYIGQDFDQAHSAWFLWITASLQYARSRGRVRLTSADPAATLDIDHAYLSDPADLEALCDGIELVERLIAAPPLQAVLEPSAEEAPPWGSRAGLPAWVKAHVGTTYHPSSTCKMGPADDPDGGRRRRRPRAWRRAACASSTPRSSPPVPAPISTSPSSPSPRNSPMRSGPIVLPANSLLCQAFDANREGPPA